MIYLQMPFFQGKTVSPESLKQNKWYFQLKKKTCFSCNYIQLCKVSNKRMTLLFAGIYKTIL